jgi:hypothetical protein
MKAVIPLAGKGTRLRPHTLTTPKPLVHVAGRPVMSYILDDLVELGITEVVFVIGYLGDEVKAWIAREYPKLTAHYVVQEVQDGTAGAVKLAEPWADDDELLILFVDTLFDADLSLATTLTSEWSGVIWAKEVEDYQRFGVIVTDENGANDPHRREAVRARLQARQHRPLLHPGLRPPLRGDRPRAGQGAGTLGRVLPDRRVPVHGGPGRPDPHGPGGGVVRLREGGRAARNESRISLDDRGAG